jgi:hypothetical protein
VSCGFHVLDILPVLEDVILRQWRVPRRIFVFLIHTIDKSNLSQRAVAQQPTFLSKAWTRDCFGVPLSISRAAGSPWKASPVEQANCMGTWASAAPGHGVGLLLPYPSV